MKIIVTLTTIPDRLPYIQRVIDSIWKQSHKPDNVELYIPKIYRRSDVGIINENYFPINCSIIRSDIDYGPATKILPAAQLHKNENVLLIYCDDDRVYESHWIERLIKAHSTNKDAAIAEETMNSEARLKQIYWRKKNSTYKILRILSVGLWKHNKKSHDLNFNIAEGYGGVLVKPSFFPEESFNIPDILWTVDDIWLSGMLAYNGIKIVKTNMPRSCASVDAFAAVSSTATKFSDLSLKKFVYKGFNRLDADMECIKYMKQNYNIWKP